MNTTEFDRNFAEIGSEHLVKAGFKFRGTGWHLLTDDFQLSYIYIKDMNLTSYSTRRISIAFDRFASVLEPGNKRQLLETPDLVSPIQINPTLLVNYISSSFSDDKWHYYKPAGSNPNRMSYQKVYYGGKEKELKDSSFERRLNTIEIDLISEKEVTDLLQQLAADVAEFGKVFAERMTINEIKRQIGTFGSNLPVEEMWLGRYEGI